MTRSSRETTLYTRLSGRPRRSSISSKRPSVGSTRATPKSVAAKIAFSCPASSRTRLNGTPVAARPRRVRNSASSSPTKVSAASVCGVRSVATHTPPGQVMSAPTRSDGRPKGSRSGRAAPSGRKRSPAPEVPRYQPELSKARAAAV